MAPVDPPADPLTLTDRLLGDRPVGTARRLAGLTAGVALAAFALSFILAAAYPGPDLPRAVSIALGLGYLAVLTLGVATALVQLAAWFAPRLRGRLALDGRRLHFRTPLWRRRVPLDRIAAGWVVHAGDLHEVEFELRGGDVLSATVHTAAEAEALLDAAGVHPDERALAMRLGGALRQILIAGVTALPAVCVGGMTALSVGRVAHLPSPAAGFLMFLLSGALVVGVVSLTAPPRVRVGRDGVAVRSRRGDVFAAFTDLAAVHRQGSAVVLYRRDGTTLSIDVAGTAEARIGALLARIQQGAFAAARPLDPSARLALLDRAGRTAADWRGALAALFSTPDAYRFTTLSRDELHGVLDDPRSPPDRRVAAAWALATLDGPAAPTGIRVAVDTAAHEPVRVALARAAEGHLDDEVTAALDAATAR
jgi:hypothetical protein